MNGWYSWIVECALYHKMQQNSQKLCNNWSGEWALMGKFSRLTSQFLQGKDRFTGWKQQQNGSRFLSGEMEGSYSPSPSPSPLTHSPCIVHSRAVDWTREKRGNPRKNGRIRSARNGWRRDNVYKIGYVSAVPQIRLIRISTICSTGHWIFNPNKDKSETIA